MAHHSVCLNHLNHSAVRRAKEFFRRFGRTPNSFLSGTGPHLTRKRAEATSDEGVGSVLRDEDGSITLLIIGLFLLVLALSMTILDVAGNFLAKQDLTHIGESAISRAAHAIDLDRYYKADRFFVKQSDKGPIYRIPIDCSQAFIRFQQDLANQTLRGNQIVLTSWNCYQDVLTAQLQSDVPLLIPVPFISANTPSDNGGATNLARIVTTVKAESLVVGAG